MPKSSTFFDRTFYFDIVSTCFAHYEALSSADKAAWAALASTVLYTGGPFVGQPTSGRTMFMTANVRLQWTGASFIDSPGSAAVPPGCIITGVNWVQGTPNNTIVTFSAVADSSNTIIIYCSPMLYYNATKASIGFNPIFWTRTALAGTVDLEPYFISRFGTPTFPGNCIYVGCTCINNDSGIATNFYKVQFHLGPAP